MEFEIKDSNSLSEIKTRFSNLFPLLKIEFVNAEHQTGEGSPKEAIINIDETVQEAGGKSGIVNLERATTVAQFEQGLHDACNLNVQVFRNSGGVWMETTTSDEWTLEEQNNHAKERSK